MLCIYVNYAVCVDVCTYNININRGGFFFFFYMCVYCYYIIITFCNKVSKIQENNYKVNDCSNITIVCPWCNGHSTSISACGVWSVECGVWGANVRIQVSSMCEIDLMEIAY